MVLNRLEEFFNLQENIRACFDMVLKLLVKCSGAQATSKAICWITEPDDNFPRELGKKDTALEVRLGSLEKSSLDKLSQGGNSLSLLSYLFFGLRFLICLWWNSHIQMTDTLIWAKRKWSRRQLTLSLLPEGPCSSILPMELHRIYRWSREELTS